MFDDDNIIIKLRCHVFFIMMFNMLCCCSCWQGLQFPPQVFQTAAVLEILHAAVGLVQILNFSFQCRLRPSLILSFFLIQGSIACDGDVPASIQSSLCHLGNTPSLPSISGVTPSLITNDGGTKCSSPSLFWPAFELSWTTTGACMFWDPKNYF